MQNINACLYVRLEERAELERLVVDGNTAQKIATRARIVLASGRGGLGTNAIMGEARTSKPSVWCWRTRYMEAGIKGLFKDKGKGKRAGKKPISEELRLKIITKTVQERPANATHWSVRTMAEEMFAALDVKTGEVIGECMPRHRASEFIRFLKKIDRVVAKSLDLHLIVDNYKTHKTKEVQAWLAKHPRFKLHFTPTSSSGSTWSNASSRRLPANAFAVAPSTASMSLRLPSPTIWESIMPTRSPST
jgi:hypothetical protein